MTALAPYAAHEHNSRGRRHPEPPPGYRSEFQRDRDRIVHSAAFRRLEYKTQVFVNHEGDMFRTRLTHSLEVAQIARSISRIMHLNEDLAETIALAHDLGHTPFGHAGQDALNRCMRDHGGFEHNLQSLRTVDELEKRYAEFDGLNLTFESREGVLKHCSQQKARELGEVGERFLSQGQPGLEAQVVNLADEIAYNNHDVDDGLRAGLIDLEQLDDVELFSAHRRDVLQRYPQLDGRQLIHETTRRMINALVVDLVETTGANIERLAPADIEAVRQQSAPLAQFSAQMREQNLELKRFLRRELYRHYRVHRMTVKADKIITALFEIFMSDIRLMPPEQQRLARDADQAARPGAVARIIADYIAGMTDRYAISEYKRLFDPQELT